MHFLNRNTAPGCLGNYRHGVNAWDKNCPTSQERADIWAALEAMQGRRCAYCECSLDAHGQHIEHFRQRGRYPQGTFDWQNLFGSCEREDSCGKHKDTCGAYNHADLIKPDTEDPEHFFLFAADGTIALRPHLTPQEQHRARETLRIFNLDVMHGPLRAMRKIAAIPYQQTAEVICDLAETYARDQWLPFWEAEVAQTRDLPFCTVIKHTLTPA